MIQTGLIQNAHNDLVTDASYDFYGLRLATCSLDQRYAILFLLAAFPPNGLKEVLPISRVKIWQLEESTGNWTVEDDWKVRTVLRI